MKEGWSNKDYWTLCEDQQEAERLTVLYGISAYLPGYSIVGLKMWDYFILCDNSSQYFIIPTVPLDKERLTPFLFPVATLRLESDKRFTNRIRWFVKPISFGGDPLAEDNTKWLSMTEHVEIVKWWNRFYYDTLKREI